VRLHVWLTIAGMAVATYLTRAPLFLVLARRPLPPRVRAWLRERAEPHWRQYDAAWARA
jgi:uncharacterized membrane protein